MFVDGNQTITEDSFREKFKITLMCCITFSLFERPKLIAVHRYDIV